MTYYWYEALGAGDDDGESTAIVLAYRHRFGQYCLALVHGTEGSVTIYRHQLRGPVQTQRDYHTNAGL